MEFKYRDKYKSTRDRITRFKHNYDMSDKEIIEFLDDEIFQYRETIGRQEEIIKELRDKQNPISKVHKELSKKDKEIEEYKQILRKIIEGQDIFSVATLNQLRKIYNLKPIGPEYYKEINQEEARGT